MNELEFLNRAWFLYINGDKNSPAWLVQTAIGMAEYLIGLVPLLMLCFWLWGDHARRSLALKACLVALLGVTANQAISVLWPHPRPFMIELGHTWIPHAADSSFPSDHMTVLAGVGITLLLDGLMGWGLAILGIGLCVAWARVFLGVHFPFDMIGAIAVAAAVYAILTPTWQKVSGPLTDIAERLYRQLFAKPIAAGWLHP